MKEKESMDENIKKKPEHRILDSRFEEEHRQTSLDGYYAVKEQEMPKPLTEEMLNELTKKEEI